MDANVCLAAECAAVLTARCIGAVRSPTFCLFKSDARHAERPVHAWLESDDLGEQVVSLASRALFDIADGRHNRVALDTRIQDWRPNGRRAATIIRNLSQCRRNTTSVATGGNRRRPGRACFDYRLEKRAAASGPPGPGRRDDLGRHPRQLHAARLNRNSKFEKSAMQRIQAFTHLYVIDNTCQIYQVTGSTKDIDSMKVIAIH